MAISLNNHETRIKALESQNSGSMKIVSIMSTYKSLSQTLTQFGTLPNGVNFIVVCGGLGGNRSQWGFVTIVPIDCVKNEELGIYLSADRSGSSTVSCKIDGNSIKFRIYVDGTTHYQDDGIRRIYGLKL